MRGNLMLIEGVPSAVGAPTKNAKSVYENKINYSRYFIGMETVFILVHQLIYRIDGVERLWKVLVKIIMHDRSSVRVFGWCHGDTKNYQPQKEEVQIFLHIDIPCAPLVVTSFLLNQFLVHGN